MPSLDEEILIELREIKKLLTPSPPPAQPNGFVQEFRAFVKQYNILGLAIAFILGVYSGALVKALVTDILLPIISLVLPGQNINTFTVGPFGIGDFINSLITFLIVTFIVFAVVKLAKRYKLG